MSLPSLEPLGPCPSPSLPSTSPPLPPFLANRCASCSHCRGWRANALQSHLVWMLLYSRRAGVGGGNNNDHQPHATPARCSTALLCAAALLMVHIKNVLKRVSSWGVKSRRPTPWQHAHSKIVCEKSNNMFLHASMSSFPVR